MVAAPLGGEDPVTLCNRVGIVSIPVDAKADVCCQFLQVGHKGILRMLEAAGGVGRLLYTLDKLVEAIPYLRPLALHCGFLREPQSRGQTIRDHGRMKRDQRKVRTEPDDKGRFFLS